MSNFIKGFAKTRRIRSVCLPSCMFLASSSTSMMSCVSQDLFSRNRAAIQRGCLVCEVFGDPRSHNMLKHLTEDTGQGNWTIICWVSFIPFLKIGDTFASFQIDGSLPVSRDF